MNSSSKDGIIIKDVPVPPVEDNEILVKVSAVAFNPTDYKHVDVVSPKGSIIGCDYAGVVVKIGQNAPGDWKIGDRAAGFVHGGLFPDRGSFAEFLKVPADLAWKVPDGVTDQEASTYGISAVTAMLAINKHLAVPLIAGANLERSNAGEKDRTDAPIFIYAGSTCAGLFAVQLAKLAGLKVVATASPHSFELVKSYGADEVFDYRSPTAVEDVLRAYPNIDRAMDCFSEGESTDFCAKVVGPNGGKVITLLDTKKSNMHGAEITFILVYTVFSKTFQWLPPMGPRFVPDPADRDAFARFYSLLPEICKKLKPPPLTSIDGGLHNIPSGLAMLREGKISGSKLVSTII
jgi:NADPH:quinone reductase-like Zn-dependent oxidoreductase